MLQSMASSTHTIVSSPSYSSSYCILSSKLKSHPPPPPRLSSHALTVDRRPSFNPLVFQAVRLLGPPARFEPSKLTVSFIGEESGTSARIVPRTYTLSHCDFTANLTLTISNIILRDQLKGWYNKDDVVAEWTDVNGNLFLNVHCFVSGPNSFSDMTAEFRYHIFSKELQLVLEAFLYGDSDFFRENQELMDAIVRVYFHSSSKKYNRMECWGPLKDAAMGKGADNINGYLSPNKERSNAGTKFWASPKSIFQALFTFLL